MKNMKTQKDETGNTGHTPGPWNSTPHYVCAGNQALAEVQIGDRVREENRANIRLMAAAPELLDMLYAVLPAVEEADEFNKPSRKQGPLVRALIAKAEGRE